MIENPRSSKSLPNDAARRILQDSRQYEQKPKVLNSDLIDIGGDSEEWNSELAEDVLQKLVSLREDFLTKDRSVTKDQTFDRIACQIIHQGLRLPLNLAADDGFWRWLSVEKFPEIVESRHNRTSELAGLGNFGIDAPSDRGRLKILWLRADIVYDDEAESPYHLADRLSPTDFWESGIIRHYYGWSPNLAKAIVDYQYPDPDSGKGTLHLTHENGIRVLYKQLRRLHTTIAFEYLTDEQVANILYGLGKGLQRG